MSLKLSKVREIWGNGCGNPVPVMYENRAGEWKPAYLFKEEESGVFYLLQDTLDGIKPARGPALSISLPCSWVLYSDSGLSSGGIQDMKACIHSELTAYRQKNTAIPLYNTPVVESRLFDITSMRRKCLLV
jgi:hypothetical protein